MKILATPVIAGCFFDVAVSFSMFFFFFFFQAEDGIRDLTVTGVQTCALPICAAFPPNRQLHSTWCENRGHRSSRRPPVILSMVLYSASIALSALLLFLVQPIIAKQILPWFGGGAGVWTTCMVFFQTLLLAGYGYAHWLARRLSPRQQWGLHTALLAASLVCLPIIAADRFRPAGGQDAAAAILVLLAAT